MNPIFKGYASHSLEESAAAYKAKTGEDPTVMIVRPGVYLKDDHPAKIVSSFGGAGLILVTHLVDYDEFKNFEMLKEEVRKASRPHFNNKPTLEEVDLAMRQPIVKKAPPGRPKKGEGICPHCKNEIYDFNMLGWWWGWEHGIEPPYWEDLRLHVLRRDNFRCDRCKEQFGMSGLSTHHRMPKENGGPDSARNLTTRCHKCHKVNEPIFNNNQ